jgi:hypothetical protein
MLVLLTTAHVLLLLARLLLQLLLSQQQYHRFRLWQNCRASAYDLLLLLFAVLT